MTSFVYYKFKSQRDESRVSFDGTGISVFDLKREIILAKGLEKAKDVDIVLLDPTTEEEYDDSRIIPRSSSVIVKRTPVRPGKGKIGKYISGPSPVSSGHVSTAPRAGAPTAPYVVHSGPMSKRFNGKDDKEETKVESKLLPVVNNIIQSDEAAALEAMFAAETENWNATQEKMSQAQRIYTAPRFGNRKPAPSTGPSSQTSANSRYHPYTDRPIPQGYVCYRCGQKGHWIQDCPTNKDREWDGKPRLKRTTGIPRSFLKTVDAPADGAVGSGVMITPEGKLVVAQPDNAAWEKQIVKSKGLTEADIRERPVSDPSLACSLCSTLFRDAVRTPCCSTSYCEECIQTHLLENDFVCPKCRSRVPSLDRLTMDKPVRTRVMDYIDKAIAESNLEVEEPEHGGISGAQPNIPIEELSNDQEVSFDEQPGGPVADVTALPGLNNPQLQRQPGYRENQSLPQIQAEIQQLQMMLSNPKLPPHIRNQTTMQLTQKQNLLNQAQTMSAFLTQAQAVLAAEEAMLAASASMYNQAQMEYNLHQPTYVPVNNWISNQQSDQDSPYQRLPVNQRRRFVKRERPSDFVEVSGQYYS